VDITQASWMHNAFLLFGNDITRIYTLAKEDIGYLYFFK
jgi:hypothetical protein